MNDLKIQIAEAGRRWADAYYEKRTLESRLEHVEALERRLYRQMVALEAELAERSAEPVSSK